MPVLLPPAHAFNKYALLFKWDRQKLGKDLWFRILFLEGACTTEQAELLLHVHQDMKDTPIAAPATLRSSDPTPIWYREITVQCIFNYAPVKWDGDFVHPYSVLLPRLAKGTLPLGDLVTHKFSLQEFDEAFQTALHRSRSHAIKVAFEPNLSGRVPPGVETATPLLPDS